MRQWSGGALALALMLFWIGMGHAFPLGPDEMTGESEAPLEFSEPSAVGEAAEPEDPEALALTPVPEPSTLVLFGAGLAGLARVGSRARPRSS